MSGAVSDSNGPVGRGIFVFAIRETLPFRVAVTDEKGQFSFAGLPTWTILCPRHGRSGDAASRNHSQTGHAGYCGRRRYVNKLAVNYEGRIAITATAIAGLSKCSGRPFRALRTTAARAQSYSHPGHRSRQSDRRIHPFVWRQSLLPLVLSGRAKHPDRPRCS